MDVAWRGASAGAAGHQHGSAVAATVVASASAARAEMDTAEAVTVHGKRLLPRRTKSSVLYRGMQVRDLAWHSNCHQERGAAFPLLPMAASCIFVAAAARQSITRHRYRGHTRTSVIRLAEEPWADKASGVTLAEAPMAAYSVEDPERTRANMVIYSRLLSEPQYQGALKLVEKYLSKFDVVNMVVAMQICARAARDQEDLKRQIRFDPAFVPLFRTVKGEVLAKTSQVSPRNLGALLWSCARLDIFDDELIDRIINDATSRLEMYSAYGIGLVVYSLGYMSKTPRAVFMQALVRELRSRIDNDFDCRDLTLIIYGMSRLGLRDDRLMKLISDYYIRTGFDTSDLRHVTTVAYAYTVLEYWQPKVFALMGRSIVEQLDDLTPLQISLASLCFAKSAEHLEESSFVMENLMKGAEKILGEFSNSELTMFTHAAGKYHHVTAEEEEGKHKWETDSTTPGKIASLVSDREIESFTMSELNLINQGLMRFKHRDEKFLKEAATQFVNNAAELTTVEIVNALYAFGQVEFTHLQFVNAMIAEIKRRNLLPDMTTLSLSTLTYSLAVCRIADDDLLNDIAAVACKKMPLFTGQQVNMVLWGMAVLNAKTYAEPLVSACLEDICSRFTDSLPERGTDEFGVVLPTVLYSSALLSGSASGIWALKSIFRKGFWSRIFEARGYAMMYYMFASLSVEAGIAVEELEGWHAARKEYEEVTGQVMGQQTQRLSERLRMQEIEHQANAMVPALEGFPEAGMRGDVVIEALRLIIEVEGPQRLTIPLNKVMSQIGARDVCGKPGEVMEEIKTEVDLGLTGSAEFKRRLLRDCGWRVITVSYDENEDYIADALLSMSGTTKASDKSAELPADATDGVGGNLSEEEDFLSGEDAIAAAPISIDDESETLVEIGTDEETFSEYEQKIRELHGVAFETLKRRILEERGNAAASTSYPDHLKFCQWQVGLEKQALKEVVAAL